MSCFIIPAAEAVVTTIVSKSVKNSEQNNSNQNDSQCTASDAGIPFSRKLKWLSNMLYGGSALLAFEHVWHGELTPWFPFLTAASNPADASVMVHEMMTVGVGMAIAVTAAWGCMLAIAGIIEKRAFSAPMMRS